MGKLLIALVAVLGLWSSARADTVSVLDDPLHGYLFGSPNTNPDNGIVTPIGSNPPVNWGFFASPAPQTGTFYIDVLTPVSAGAPGSMTLTAGSTLTGTLTQLATPWTTSGQLLSDFLGLPSGSPPNKCCGVWDGDGTGYYVDQISFSSITLDKLSTSTMDESLTNTLAMNSLIVAFLVVTTTDNKGNTTTSTVDTANSGALFVGTTVPQTPLPAAFWMLLAPLAVLWRFGTKWAIPSAA